MTYKVLVTRHSDNRYTARAFAVPDIVASGATESEAVAQLRVALAEMQQHSRVVQIDLPLSGETPEHPWLRFAGMWEHDPDWEAFRQEVESYRRAIDIQFPPE